MPLYLILKGCKRVYKTSNHSGGGGKRLSATGLTCANDAPPATFKGNLHPSRNYAAVWQHPRSPCCHFNYRNLRCSVTPSPFLSHLEHPGVRHNTDELCQQKTTGRRQRDAEENRQICGHECDHRGINSAPKDQSVVRSDLQQYLTYCSFCIFS